MAYMQWWGWGGGGVGGGGRRGRGGGGGYIYIKIYIQKQLEYIHNGYMTPYWHLWVATPHIRGVQFFSQSMSSCESKIIMAASVYEWSRPLRARTEKSSTHTWLKATKYITSWQYKHSGRSRPTTFTHLNACVKQLMNDCFQCLD